MKCNTFYEGQCCTSCFKSEGTKNSECPPLTPPKCLITKLGRSLAVTTLYGSPPLIKFTIVYFTLLYHTQLYYMNSICYMGFQY